MRKIYFRADASTTIGYGHFIRTLALADMLKDNFSCTFFTCHPTSYQIGEIEKVCPYVVLQEDAHYEEFLSYIRGDEVVVLDNYFYGTEYQLTIKQRGCCLVCIDDTHDKHYVADVVINHTLTDISLFDIEPYTELCLGFKWALLRKPFLDVTKRCHTPVSKIEKIAVCFGGSDEYDNTGLFINKLLPMRDIKSITAVVGDAYFPKYTKTDDKRVYYCSRLTADRMASLFCNVDLVICSASSVCIEALACGAVIAVGWYVDNQIDFYNLLVNNGFAIPLGNIALSLQQTVDVKTIPNKKIVFNNIQHQYVELFSKLNSH